jgi:hypothetical protein
MRRKARPRRDFRKPYYTKKLLIILEPLLVTYTIFGQLLRGSDTPFDRHL